MADFVHLHLHSEYSLLDGACRIDDIVQRAKEVGHTAVALTDHGAMYGAVKFYSACKNAGIKAIIGCEVYVARRSRFQKEGKFDTSGTHLVLLCENEIGYRNLIHMVSRSFTEGFYSKPRIDLDLLREHHEGLIALSGCIGGAIPELILQGDISSAEKYALEMKGIFGDEHFYFEIQNHKMEEEARVNGHLLQMSEKLQIPLVATNDVHYIHRKDAETQAVLMCIQTNTLYTDGAPIGFTTKEYYYKTTEEMQLAFPNAPKALENTVRIAERCNFSFTFGELHLPKLPGVPSDLAEKMLEDLAHQGFYQKVTQGRIDFSNGTEQEYLERISYELSIIRQMGFHEYYLIVRDFIAYAKENDIAVGPGRGSGAGSMVAFCIGITEIDPFAFGLIFERFLNPDRSRMPDFDTDFCYVRREEVISYVKRRYGEDHVAQIVTFGTLAPRSAVRSVGKALGIPYAEVDRIASLIPRDLGITLESALKNESLLSLYNSSDTCKKIIDISRQIEGMPRHISTHAAGVVITEAPVSSYVPLALSGEVTISEYDMDAVALLGLVKFDFLGLRYLTILADAVKEIQTHTPNFTLEKIPLDDEATYRMISEGKTDGVFQLESGGMKQMLTELQPKDIYDIIASIALYRPGPMASIPQYIARKHQKEEIRYETPLLKEILQETYGCIVYQEQVMKIFQVLAGYSLSKADIVMRAMSKKKADVLEAERKNFLEGSAAHGVDRQSAEKIFDEMASFAKYAFNKSHAAAYAMTSYRTAYLKKHYTKEYMSAILSSVFGNAPTINAYVHECKEMGIPVLAPSINESKLNFSVSGDSIRFGLLAIKNIGTRFAEIILKERAEKPFQDFEDFVRRIPRKEWNKRQLDSLIQCGAFDGMGQNRAQLLTSCEKVMQKYEKNDYGVIEGQIDFFHTEDTVVQIKPFLYPDMPEFSMKDLLALEKESSGMYFSGHILDSYSHHMQDIPHESIHSVLKKYSEDPPAENQKHTFIGTIAKITYKKTKKGDRMAFVQLEDAMAEMEMILFPKDLERVQDMLYTDHVVCVTGSMSFREEESPNFLLSDMFPLVDNEHYSPTAAEKAVAKKTIYVKISHQASPLIREILEYAKSYPGSSDLIFFSEETKKYFKAEGAQTHPTQEVIRFISQKLGSENVVIK